MAKALKHERCATPGCRRKGQTHRPEFEGLCKRCFAGDLPEWQPCVNAHLGCTRKATTDRPCYDGRCQTCYITERKGLPFVPSSYRRRMSRCPSCEALLAYVKHEGGVCMMERCRREAGLPVRQRRIPASPRATLDDDARFVLTAGKWEDVA